MFTSCLHHSNCGRHSNNVTSGNDSVTSVKMSSCGTKTNCYYSKYLISANDQGNFILKCINVKIYTQFYVNKAIKNPLVICEVSPMTTREYA